MVEGKQSDERISKSLGYFQQQVKAPFAFQVIVDAEFVDADCFANRRGTWVVPARTFLSQLL